MTATYSLAIRVGKTSREEADRDSLDVLARVEQILRELTPGVPVTITFHREPPTDQEPS